MKIITRKFDPSLRQMAIEAPARSTIVLMRMSPHGECDVVLQAPDEDAPVDPLQVLVLFEDDHVPNGIDMAAWRWVSSWRYPSGRIAHGFAALPARKPRS